MTAPQAMSLSFSTEDLPARDRLPIWREVFARTIIQADMEPIAEGPFRCDAKLSALPGLGIVSLAMSGTRVNRRREMIADGKDDFVLSIPLKGSGVYAQRGREVLVEKGAGILMAGAEPGDVVFRTTSHFCSIAIPSRALSPLISRDAAVMQTIPADTNALRLLAGYVALLEQGHALAAPGLQHSAAFHVYDLAALAIGAMRDAAHVASGRGARAARLAAIRADILANLSQVRLSPKLIARRHGVSERYVHSLFADTGETFGEFVTAARLTRAHDLLSGPAPGCTVSDIAQSVGYADVTTFNRAFRRRYGNTPAGVREAGRLDS